jgi:hypothetical protein
MDRGAAKIVMKTVSIGSNRRFAMSAKKPLILGILVWSASFGVVRADPISFPNNFNWVAYFAGQNSNGGNNPVAPISPPAPTQPVAAPMVTQPAPPVQAAQAIPVSLIANAPVAQPPPVLQPAPTPAPAPTPVPAVPVASGPVDAFINLGNGPYPLQGSITTGNAQPWYDSSQLTSVFGGQPSAAQIQSFDNAILQHVQQAFSLSGVSVTLSDNPNVSALHTLSLVSNTASAALSSAIGMTQVGASGFSFIDKIAPSAQSVSQLEWIVAHNISHELMLAFGVPENYDQSGNYIDSKLANWSMMVSPSSTFSPSAAAAIAQAIATQDTAYSASQLGAQAQEIGTVPEPTTIAIWALAGAAAFITHRVRARKIQG